MTQAERSQRARDIRAREQKIRTQTLATLLPALTLSASDEGGHEVVTALGKALIGCALDMYCPPGESGPDAAFRAAVRSLHAAFSEELGDEEAGMGALRQATNEIDRRMVGERHEHQ